MDSELKAKVDALRARREARALGESDLYRGDDSRVYVS